MKVLIIDPPCFVLYYNLCYCHSVAKLGVEIEILTSYFKYDYIEPPSNVKLKYTFFKIGAIFDQFFDSKNLRRIYRAIEYPFNLLYLLLYSKWSRADIVHFSWSILPRLDYWAMWALKRMGLKIVYTAHNPFPHDQREQNRKKYTKIYRVADKIIVLTHYVKKQIESYSNIQSSKISVIPHGNYHYIVDQFQHKDNVKKNREVIVGFVGLIRPYKGLDYLLKAFSIVIKQLPWVQLSIIGKSMERFDKYQALIKSLGISKQISIKQRYIPMKDFIPLVSNIDLVVFPNISASQSGSIAMLYDLGIPVVVTDVGGLPEMVSEGESGYIVPAKDEPKLAEAIIHILSDRDKLEKMKQTAKQFGDKHFSWDLLAPNAVAVYQELLN